MKYLLNFASLNENHQDIADYERLYRHCLRLVRVNSQHKSFYKVLKTALTKFTNDHLKSIAVRLLAELNVEIHIDSKTINNLLKNPLTRNSTFLLLRKIENFDFKEIIHQFLYDDTFESKEFFEFLKKAEKERIDFLTIRNPIYIRKQLLIMNYTNDFYDLDYFLPYLGSNYRSLCYLVYEHIVCIVERRKQGNNQTYLSDSKNIFYNSENNTLLFKQPIKVENNSNFLIYFLPFLNNKENILKAIIDKDVSLVSNLLKSYIFIDNTIQISRHKHLYSTSYKVKPFLELEFENDNQDFDFLFEERSYKTLTDCVEL